MRIGIVGAGGVGGFFAAQLIRAGHEVIVIARGAHLAAIHQRGLQVSTSQETYVVTPHLVTDDPSAAGKVDLVIVAVKTWQLGDVLPTIQALVDVDTVVLPLLNGVEAATILSESVGQAHVVGGICHIVAEISAPGQIRQSGTSFDIVLGELDGSHTQRLANVQQVLASSQIPAIMTENIWGEIWEKFLFVVPFGTVGALTRLPLGIMRKVPETYQLLIACMREILAVAVARGVHLDEAAVDRSSATFNRFPEDVTASMQRDIIAGRRSELEAQAGAVIRLGAEVGVLTPNFSTLYACLVPYEWRAQGKIMAGE